MTTSNSPFCALAWLSIVCGANSVSGSPPVPAPVEAPAELIGVWRQVDDGRYVQIHADRVDWYDHTQTVCYRVPPDSGKPLGDSFALYSLDDGGAGLTLWKDDYGDRFERFYSDRFARVASLPEGAIADPEGDPRFDDPAFLARLVRQTFDEQFPFFPQRAFDWPPRARRLVATMKASSTDEQLFEALCAALDGLGDSHTRVYWSGADAPFKSGRTRVLSHLEAAFATQQRFKENWEFNADWHSRMKRSVEPFLEAVPLKTAANGRIRWGVLRGNVGYIENEFMNGFSPPGTPRPRELVILSEELDRVIAALADCRAIVLDLSLNAGGYDPAALTIASRFADKRRHVMSLRSAGQPADQTRNCYVRPDGPTQITNPVFVLTSNQTVSAGEALVLALKAFPHVTQVGEPTRGCLSAFLNKWLPDGFHLTLSNQIWTAPDGRVPEGVGLQPDRGFPVFPADDLYDGYAKAIDRTINLAVSAESAARAP